MKQLSHQTGTEPTGAEQAALRDRLAALRGPGRQPRPLDSRALTALAANPGCSRRALLDSAGVDKAALAEALGAPANFGQSQFAFARGHAFEAGATRDGGLELVRLLCAHTGQVPPDPQLLECPDLTAEGQEGRIESTREALARAQTHGQGGEEARQGRPGSWSVLLHPMVRLTVAGAPVCLEPDAIVVDGDAGVTIVEIKSFPILDGSAAPTKVGAATRQAAVYGLALEAMGVRAAESVLLVCPKDFSNLPTAALVDMRKQLAAVRRQLHRLTRVEELTAALPAGTSFDLDLPPDRLAGAVDSVPAAYAPECLAGCDLAFHCRSQARTGNDPAVLGRGTRAELGALTTVKAALDAAHSDPPPPEPEGAAHPAGPSDPPDPAVLALRRAARLRAEVLGPHNGTGPHGATGPGSDGASGSDGATGPDGATGSGPAGGGPCR